MVRAKLVWIGNIILLMIVVLSACNPKPQQEEQYQKQQETIFSIPEPEKIITTSLIFQDYQLLVQGLELMGTFWGINVTEDDKNKIFSDSHRGYDSTIDFLEMLRSKGLNIIPIYGTFQEIQESINQRLPVLSEFQLNERNIQFGIFYAYSEQSLFYYQLPSMKKREIPIERINSLQKDQLKLFLIEEDKENNNSEYYFYLQTQDVFYKDDRELYKILIEQINLENLLLIDRNAQMIYSIYYTFHEPNPEKVQPILKTLRIESNDSVFYQEITFMTYVNQNEFDKASDILLSINLVPEQLNTFRDITLYHIGLISMENGEWKTAEQAFQVLALRDSEYPGLHEAMQRLQDLTH